MYCRMTRGIFFRANGELPCYCASGEQLRLGKVPTDSFDYDFVKDFYFNARFNRVRQHMQNDKLPWPSFCLKCNYIDPYGSWDTGLISKEIEWAHIESSALCNLRCPFCVHGIPQKIRKYKRPEPLMMPYEMFDKSMRDIANAGLNFTWMYFSGRGEPTLHPEIWKMVKLCKDIFDTNFLVNTNGNTPFKDMIVDSGLDKIKIALDSVFQEPYAKYRIGGNVERVIDLTRNIIERKRKLGVTYPEVIWQKVLFDFSDSDEELLAYQAKAKELGVDTVLFNFTWTENYSKRTPDDIPKTFPNLRFGNFHSKFHLSPKAFEEKIARAESSSDPRDWIKLATDITHWFYLGISTRDDMDSYAKMPFSDKRQYISRINDPHYEDYLKALAHSFARLDQIYRERGEGNHARVWRDMSEMVPVE